MNREEALKICTILEANYQPFKDLDTAVSLWQSAFADIPFELVHAAVLTYMMSETDTFRPNVGKITAEVDRILYGEQMSDMEAWEIVRQAVSKSAQTESTPYREWKKLPEDIKQIVSVDQLIRWQMMDVEQMDTVIQSNFSKSYQTVKRREYKNRVIPQEMKDAFAYLQSKNPDYNALPEATKPELPERALPIELTDDAMAFRKQRGMVANPEYDARVEAFKAPMEKADFARMEYAEKRKMAVRMAR